MYNKEITYKSIGTIFSPFKDTTNMPVQPVGGEGIQGKIILNPDFVEGLKDLTGFSHIYVLFHLHEIKQHHLIVPPFLDDKPHGVFATRSPKRPNPIGLSIVKLVSIEGNILTIENIDMLDGTPVLDIKPFVPPVESQDNVRVGWVKTIKGKIRSMRSPNNRDV